MNHTDPRQPLEQVGSVPPLEPMGHAPHAAAPAEEPSGTSHGDRSPATLQAFGEAGAGYCADGVCYLPGS